MIGLVQEKKPQDQNGLTCAKAMPLNLDLAADLNTVSTFSRNVILVRNSLVWANDVVVTT